MDNDDRKPIKTKMQLVLHQNTSSYEEKIASQFTYYHQCSQSKVSAYLGQATLNFIFF